MGTLKQRTIDNIIEAEGGYVNRSDDSGGETNFGITVAVARANGYQGEMVNMSQKCAEAIYERRYWDAVRGDDLAGLSVEIAAEVVDTAVNMGVPLPAMSAALAYFDGYRCERLPANLLQAQRDYFGAHTYERLDKPRGEFFHTNWTGRGGGTSASTYTV